MSGLMPSLRKSLAIGVRSVVKNARAYRFSMVGSAY
jgi:hypothetical protein